MSSLYPFTEKYKKAQKKARDREYHRRRSVSVSINQRRMMELSSLQCLTRSQERTMQVAQSTMQGAFQGQHSSLQSLADLAPARLPAVQSPRYSPSLSSTEFKPNQSRFEEGKTEETSDDEVEVVTMLQQSRAVSRPSSTRYSHALSSTESEPEETSDDEEVEDLVATLQHSQDPRYCYFQSLSSTGSKPNQSRFEEGKTEETSDDKVEVIATPGKKVAILEIDDDGEFGEVEYTMTPAKTPGGEAVFTPVTDTVDSLMARILALEQENDGLKKDKLGLQARVQSLEQDKLHLEQENLVLRPPPAKRVRRS